MLQRTSTIVELDTDAVSPDSLRAAVDVAISALISRTEANGQAVDWNQFEVVLNRISSADSQLVVRVGVVR